MNAHYVCPECGGPPMVPKPATPKVVIFTDNKWNSVSARTVATA